MESSLKLLVLLSCVAASDQFCEIPSPSSSLVEKATQQLLTWIDRRSPSELNPSVYVGLRLSNQPRKDQSELYLTSLMTHYQQAFSSFSQGLQHKPPMGQLALYLLAMRGGCKDIDTRKGSRLVTHLKHELEEEKHNIGHDHKGHPLTNYYQYSLTILALCIHGKKVPGHVVEKLLHAADHDLFLHGSQFSVDTAAMASLAFSCLLDLGLNPGLTSSIYKASKHVRNKILEEETPEGYFGNIYSTPLALQALIAAPSHESEQACHRAGNALVKGLQKGAFQNPMSLSQLLPVLFQKTYLNLIQLDCTEERVEDLLEADTGSLVVTPAPQNIEVSLRVQMDPLGKIILHESSYSVPEGATLQDVLIKAKETGEFSYETQDTLSGPFVTSVMGVSPGERQYWQLLQDPEKPLQQGIAYYRPQNGETILLRLASW